MNETVTGAQTEATKIEGALNPLLPLLNIIPGVGSALDAGVTGAEAVTNTILAETASHAAPLTIAEGAVKAVAVNAASVIATLPAHEAEKATAGLNLLQTILADLKGLFGL